MNIIEIFLENTKDEPPHNNVSKFCSMNKNTGIAIDFGCGAGRDTIFLIKNGWKVISVDKENTKMLIEKHLNDEEKSCFKFVQSNFENCKLEKNNLFVANFSLPFCKKDCFEELWSNIVNSIEKNRIFYWKFLWI